MPEAEKLPLRHWSVALAFALASISLLGAPGMPHSTGKAGSYGHVEPRKTDPGGEYPRHASQDPFAIEAERARKAEGDYRNSPGAKEASWRESTQWAADRLATVDRARLEKEFSRVFERVEDLFPLESGALYGLQTLRLNAHDAFAFTLTAALLVAELGPAQKPLQLANEYDWLRVRGTGDEYIDNAVKRYGQALARREFAKPVESKDLAVLATGIRRTTVDKLSEQIGADRITQTASLHQALENYASGPADVKVKERLATELKALSGKILILVAHHEGRAANEDSGVIYVSDNNRATHKVKVDDLQAMAKSEGVELMLVGCSTSLSASLGTTSAIRTDAAVAGLGRLFRTPVTSFGDVVSRMQEPGMEFLMRADFSLTRKLRVTIEGAKHGKSTKTTAQEAWILPSLAGRDRPAYVPAVTVTASSPAGEIPVPLFASPTPPPTPKEDQSLSLGVLAVIAATGFGWLCYDLSRRSNGSGYVPGERSFPHVPIVPQADARTKRRKGSKGKARPPGSK
jgi:hypothetical protein